MSGDTSLQSQLARLVESVLFLSGEVGRLRATCITLNEINKDQVELIAGLIRRVNKLEQRRIHLYIGEDSNPCVGTGDWQDTLEGFTNPRDFADEFADKDDEGDLT